jgi:hypothetical protein
MTTATQTQIVNLTPHALHVVLGDTTKTLTPSGTVARVSSTSTQVGDLDGIPLFNTTFGQVQDLPDQQDGVLLVVSALVRSALPDRKDLASPGDLVRDSSGNVVGCKGLIVN